MQRQKVTCRYFLFLSFTCAVVGAMPAVLADTMGGASDGCPATISSLNTSFRESYSAEKERIRKQLGPVIISNGGELILLFKGQRQARPCVPLNYTILKTVDHIPLGIYVILMDQCDKSLSAETLNKLRDFKAFIDKATTDVSNSDFSTKTKARQNEIISRSVSFIDNALTQGKVSGAELLKFTRLAAKDTLLNADEGIADQFKMMDAILIAWRDKMSPEEWKQSSFVLMSGHMPRQQYSALQYFEKITGERQEGKRIIYAESLNDEDKGVDLLVTHILDRRIAINFFDDEWRMHRDLLSDAATRYLKKHRPLEQ